MEQLELEDLLLIGEAVLGMTAEALVGATRLPLARSALDAAGRCRELSEQAAVLCSRLIRNHPLPDGNKRVALLAMLELIARNGGRWTPPPGGQREIAVTLERVAARELSETALIAWVRERVAVGAR
jgi:death-on-curing protein